jgi:hypothetical protein
MIKVSVLYPNPERTTKFDIAYYLDTNRNLSFRSVK